jgi:GNAT superfamily N-acetyltransferase
MTRYHLSLDMSVAAAARDYHALTFPGICTLARARIIHEPLVTVVATDQRQMIGLALAEMRPDRASAEVLSLFVVPQCRGQGIGTTLLRHLAKALAGQGCDYIDFVYQTDWSSVAAIERLLVSSGWATPQTRMVLGKSTIDRMATIPWLSQISLPEAFAIFPWSELSDVEQQAIQTRQATEHWYPPVLTPFQEEQRLEPLNSLGLRYQRQVVGWMITHRVDEQTIQYTSLFVQKDLQGPARSVRLAGEAIRRQIASGVPRAMFQMDVDNAPMLRFAQHHLRPYLAVMTESRASRRFLRL